jgi:Lipopolysaccharide-assembly
MGLNKYIYRINKYVILAFLLLIVNSCAISYKFNGASIDYTKTKTISIADFPNRAELIYPPFSQEFTEKLRDTYAKQTRLRLLKKGGNLQLEGSIVGYTLTPMAISADSYSSETKLTVTISVRFTNTNNPDDDFEKKYTSYQIFPSSKLLTDVQDDLMKVMVLEICDNIYNDTVAKW